MRPLLAAAAAALLALPAAAEPGATGASTLARPLGARPIAMGQAFCAVAGGLDSIGSNPAGLAFMKRAAAQTQYSHGIVDDSFGAAAYAHPASFGSIWADGLYYDAGSVHLTLSDGTDETVKAEQDFAGAVGASASLGGGLSVGAAAKAYRLRLAQQASAQGFAADVGAQWRSPVRGLSFGASARNLGPDVKFEQDGDPLPLEGRVGAAFTLPLSSPDPGFGEPSGLTLTADGVQPRGDKAWAATGAELRFGFGGSGTIALRAGYVFDSLVDSFTLGVGLKEGRYFLDYALGDQRAFSNAHHFVLGASF